MPRTLMAEFHSYKVALKHVQHEAEHAFTVLTQLQVMCG